MKKQLVMLIVGTILFTTNSAIAMQQDNQGAPTKSSAAIKLLLPKQPLTLPLPARSGTKVVTPDWLLSLPHDSLNDPVLRWLDNTHLLYSAPPRENKPNWTIELLDVDSGKSKFLGEGSDPKPSPDHQWIGFIHGEKEAKQLWIMHSDGKDKQQLSHVKGGLGEFFFDFAWSPDSKQIALTHRPEFHYWEKKKAP